MAEYKFKSESFKVDDAGDCSVKVSDGTNVASITLNSGGNTVYRVSVVGSSTWWAINEPGAAVEQACKALIQFRAKEAVAPADACKAMSKFVADL